MTVEQLPDASPPSTEPDTLLALKEILLTTWQQLPPEHQASLAMVILEPLMNGDYKQWLREAIDLRWPVTPDTFPATFGLVKLSQDDLRRAQFDENETAQLDDQDLQEVAHAIRNHFIYDVFWYEVRYVTQARLEGKV